MISMASEAYEYLSESPQPNETEFLFTSMQHDLRATGKVAEIITPAFGGGCEHSNFQQALRGAMEQARQAGQVNPIVVGAIPFDLNQASCLYIPAQYQWVERSEPIHVSRETKDSPTLLNQRSIPDEQGFKKAVQHAIVNFQHSDIRKAVLSRICELQFSEPVDVQRLLASLRTQNPSGYQFRVPLSEGGELIGVSPELLLRKRGGQIQSNPLAGSAKRQADPEQDRAIADRLMSSPKDQYEHHLVIDEIRRVLEPHCAELDIPDHPSLMSTSALWHLSTQIKGRLRNPELNALQLACQLHPTPAVCGYPTGQARKLINLVEPFERGLFTGIVGWCDSQGNGEWVVTIRCGIVQHKNIRLFAGAGIVEASQPDAEWNETQAKLGTMLNACGLGWINGLDTPA